MSVVRRTRAAYIRSVVAERKARSRLIFRRKQGAKAIKLKRVLARARKNRRDAKAAYERAKYAAANPKTRMLRWAQRQVGTREATGNNDGPKILKWQRHTARGATYLDRAPYCGIGCENAAAYAGYKTDPRWASVAYIEDDARAGRNGFDRWVSPNNWKSIHKDEAYLVVLFGRGVHVEVGRRIGRILRVAHTIGFNTSPGNSGSQSNGGGVWNRSRPLSQVYGFAVLKRP
jgi:hypothetical protein